MPRRYWYVILTYVIGLLSGVIGGPLLVALGVPMEQVSGVWSIIVFPIMAIVIIQLLRPDMKQAREQRSISTGHKILWVIGGFFLVLAANYSAAMIELALGIEPGSDNTANLMNIARDLPLFLIVTAILAPLLEEVVFRKIIFGSIYKKYNFFIAAIISAIIFGILHQEPEHLLIYTSVGMVFAFVYVKTKTILVPILIHVSINTFVFLIQYNVTEEDIERMREELEQLQTILIGG
ncbi:CPBP family intramembrane glutamic endopeptidase [Salinibacillus xinjiangensis]|uniref:CPBP family intramembrane metalloprotease n=1 Tax=Salinibacillus xinjiangensis TaxID=1229268 RepID=A0A6G1X969_9BACI|nr:type II CAAX endopeptidase family protein [Salinibacillus xinjiangensis]MRG87348.1 CPBP family intramembrane metalloprotease [Salinibacillus xinjiangensis]